jgi:Xylose isomerase-like TIM barrel
MFSFTNEWLTRRYTLEQILASAAELDIGPGLEVIGFQTWRTYPQLTTDEVLNFRRLVDALGFEPAALGGYVDLARRTDRLLTVPEAVEFLRPQIETARRLGFPVLRLHAGIPVEVLEQLAPAAAAAGVTLGTEFQGQQSPDAPAVAAIVEAGERVESGIGIVLDFSVAMTAVPKFFMDAVCGLGMSAEDLGELVALWGQGVPTGELFAALGEVDAPPAAIGEARGGFFRFGRQEPQAWLPLVPHIVYAHAKFWELDDTDTDPTVRTGDLLTMLDEAGYGGFVCSEWGGSSWVDADEVDAFDLVRRHRELCNQIVDRPAEVPA